MRLLLLTISLISVFNLGWCQCTLTVSDDIDLCKDNQTVYLTASAKNALYYKWSPATGLNADNIANPLATPTKTTTYYIEALVTNPKELVYNGSFEEGNKGFSSAYKYTPDAMANIKNLSAGQYAISKSPLDVHNCFVPCIGDGKMLIVNGANKPNVVIWSQTIEVEKETDYAFSAFLQNVTCGGGSMASLQFSINDVLIGPVFQSDSIPCITSRFYSIWNSKNNTTAVISIINQATKEGGNDFVLDNISFRKSCLLFDSVKVSINRHFFHRTVEICLGDSFYVQGRYQKRSGQYYDKYINAKGCDSIISTDVIVVFDVINKNVALCEGDSLFIKNKYIKADGLFTDTVISRLGCKALEKTVVFTITPRYSYYSHEMCESDNFRFGKKIVNQTGVYTDTVFRQHCPDTIKTLQLSVLPYPTDTFKYKVCRGDSINIHGRFFSTDTVVIDTIPVKAVCDSIAVSVIKMKGVPLKLEDTAAYCGTDFAVIDAGNYKSYLWNTGETVQTVRSIEEKVYHVTVRDSTNCTYTDTVIVVERCKPLYFIPNSFTPNGDGTNDFFTISTHNVYEMDFKIIDRWGEVVFYTQNPHFAWDGHYKNEKLPLGMYLWTGTFVGMNKAGYNIRQNETGYILLLD
ncbi:MAG: gliding motility-associated C-terminal domain-containing protein [Bacteroidota bacterium]